jgi:hypothetical protein
MSRITHFKQQPKSVYYWDYYILCRLNMAAAVALQRMEYWDGTKDTAVTHAEAYNDALKANNQPATQDTSHWIYKSQDELQWELMGITGEKGTAALLKFLQEDVNYLAMRHNPDLPFDRKKQYEFQAERIQEHLDYLTYIINYFQHSNTRLTLVYYAIELLTRERVYIEELSIAHVVKKLAEMQGDSKLPKFLKNEFARDKTLSHEATGDIVPFRNIAEWKTAKLRNRIPQFCGMDTAKLRDEFRESAGYIPQECGSNSSNYNQSLQTVITDQKESVSSNNASTQEAAVAATHTRTLLEIENLTSEEVELAARTILERRQQTPPPLEETAPSSSIESKQKETGKSEKTATKTTRRRTTSKPELSLQAVAILSAWSIVVWGTSNKETPRTKDNVAAAEELARSGATEEDLRNVRERLLSQKDGFWEARGVSLKNIANNFHLAAQGPLPSSSNSQTKTDYNEVAGMTDDEREEYKRQQKEKYAKMLPAGMTMEAYKALPQDERIKIAKEARARAAQQVVPV